MPPNGVTMEGSSCHSTGLEFDFGTHTHPTLLPRLMAVCIFYLLFFFFFFFLLIHLFFLHMGRHFLDIRDSDFVFFFFSAFIFIQVYLLE